MTVLNMETACPVTLPNSDSPFPSTRTRTHARARTHTHTGTPSRPSEHASIAIDMSHPQNTAEGPRPHMCMTIDCNSAAPWYSQRRPRSTRCPCIVCINLKIPLHILRTDGLYQPTERFVDSAYKRGCVKLNPIISLSDMWWTVQQFAW